jgi:ATP adenylyltransferase/5',5'''-P-1,P-4-tetraphosphate phosphorylase II
MSDEMEQGKYLESKYKEGLAALRNEKLRKAYNLIFTTTFMLIVPRSREKALELYALNAMAFAGSIAVKTEEAFDKIDSDKCTPMLLLKNVTF